MGIFYSEIGQNIQSTVASQTIFWSLTILLVIIVITVMIAGYKEIFNKNRFKWLLLHTASVLIVGYSIKDIILNKYTELIIFAIAITFLAKLYRILMFHEKLNNKSIPHLLKWAGINFGTFYLIMILFEVVALSDNLLKILYSGVCLTLVGALFNKKH